MPILAIFFGVAPWSSSGFPYMQMSRNQQPIKLHVLKFKEPMEISEIQTRISRILRMSSVARQSIWLQMLLMFQMTLKYINCGNWDSLEILTASPPAFYLLVKETARGHNPHGHFTGKIKRPKLLPKPWHRVFQNAHFIARHFFNKVLFPETLFVAVTVRLGWPSRTPN